jgi:hypothetical protein
MLLQLIIYYSSDKVRFSEQFFPDTYELTILGLAVQAEYHYHLVSLISEMNTDFWEFINKENI